MSCSLYVRHLFILAMQTHKHTNARIRTHNSDSNARVERTGKLINIIFVDWNLMGALATMPAAWLQNSISLSTKRFCEHYPN